MERRRRRAEGRRGKQASDVAPPVRTRARCMAEQAVGNSPTKTSFSTSESASAPASSSSPSASSSSSSISSSPSAGRAQQHSKHTSATTKREIVKEHILHHAAATTTSTGGGCCAGPCCRWLPWLLVLLLLANSWSFEQSRDVQAALQDLDKTVFQQDCLRIDGCAQSIKDYLTSQRWHQEATRLWWQFEQALNATHEHFDDTPTPSVFRLLPLLWWHIEWLKAHKDLPDTAWREWAQEPRAQKVGKEQIQQLQHWAQFASLAYEPASAIREQLQQQGFELLQWEPQVRYERPCYYVAFNNRRRQVVVAVRGTVSPDDMLTDAIHTPVPFTFQHTSNPTEAVLRRHRSQRELAQGRERAGPTYVHSGISEAARFIVSRTLPLLTQLFQPLSYQVTLTGHSLGAGVASLAALILRQELNLTVHAFGYAPPPTVDRASADMADEMVWSVVHNDDIIPRFNLGLLASVIFMADRVLEEMDEKGLTFAEYYNESKSYEQTMQELREFVEKRFSRFEQKPRMDMQLLGKVVHFVRTKEGYIWRQVPRDSASLRRIEISLTLLTDHMIDGYVNCLHEAMGKL